MELYELKAKVRTETGKEAAGKARRQQEMIPAVTYGPLSEPRLLYIKESDLKKATNADTMLYKLEIENGDKETKAVMIREIQRDPVLGFFLHVDFYEFDIEKETVFDISIHLTGKPKGIAEGGVLDVQMRSIQVKCLPLKAPAHLEIDISALNIGDSVHVRDLQLPEGVEPLRDADFAVAGVTAPVAAIVEEELAEEEAAEGEEGLASEAEASEEG